MGSPRSVLFGVLLLALGCGSRGAGGMGSATGGAGGRGRATVAVAATRDGRGVSRRAALQVLPVASPERQGWALRAADAATASAVTTVYQGALSKPIYNGGAVVLGVGSRNINDAWGTFYEGALMAGVPADATDLAVLRNVQALGYGR